MGLTDFIQIRRADPIRRSVAERILADWDSYVAKFVRVMPTEYRAVLERQHLGTSNDMARLAAV